MTRNVFVLGILSFVVFLSIAYYLLFVQLLPIAHPGYTFDIVPGSSIGQVARKLQQQNIIKYPRLFRWYAFAREQQLLLKAGEYYITQDLTQAELLAKFVAGDVAQYPITLVEGWRFKRVLETIQSHPKIKPLLLGISHEEVSHEIQRPAQNLEGVFLPDTYLFTKGTSDIEILQRAFDSMQKQLGALWQRRDKDIGLKTPYEALILASIIEKESHLKEEFIEISGVYHRRLRKNMRLQADPTVIYAMGDTYQGKLYRTHLKIDSPYNTYRHRGLPPGPIALPSLYAIKAAMSPMPGDTLFFVANKKGGHTFSVTLEEHNKAVQEFYN